MAFLKTLSGHSGCIVALYDDGEKLFVKKRSGNIDYNRRLRKQMIKQRLFNAENIFAPVIYEKGYDVDDGTFYFSMQYLNCQSLASYMNCIRIKEIAQFIDDLFEALCVEEAKINLEADEIFKAKIGSLEKALKNRTEIEKYALSVLKNYDFSNIPCSPCHGDLTTENILITNDKKIYLIDFLDSFYNSWMIDIAKLLQDLELGWSYRHEQISENLKIRLLIGKEALLENISLLEDGDEKIKQIYHILLLNVLRIVPYTKDKETEIFLQNSIQKILKIIAQ